MDETASSEGSLFVVATPIGNMGDITLRALEVLKNVDVIAAEGVERTRALCRHYDIKTKVRSFNQHNQRNTAPELVLLMKRGKSVALVTNAGTPCISDPGTYLVSLALAAGVKVTPVPGASALAAGLSVSGVRAERFVFLGFLPTRQAQRRKELGQWKHGELPLVIYEAPHRILDTLCDIWQVLGDVRLTMLREMTKMHEEIRRGKVSDMLLSLENTGVKGEIVLVVEPPEKGDQSVSEEIKRLLVHLVTGENLPIKQVAAKVSTETGIPYRKIYKACLEIRRMEKQ